MVQQHCDVVHGLYKGTPCFYNVIRFNSTRSNVDAVYDNTKGEALPAPICTDIYFFSFKFSIVCFMIFQHFVIR